MTRTDTKILDRVRTDFELAWAAGLFSGEGCAYVHAHAGRGYAYAGFSIGMCDKRSIVRFREAILPYIGARVKSSRVGVEINSRNRAVGEPFHTVHLVGKPARSVLEALLLHLEGTDKGDQIVRVLTETLQEDDLL